MNKKLNGIVGLVVVAAIIGAANLILSSLPLRMDLTGEKLYTLTKGSKAVLAKLEQDVTLKFYLSSSSAEMPMQLKTYAQQVQNLLKEYELAGKGHVTLEAYDPKPDSDAEEWAQRYGVEPQNVNPFGQPVYFGLVAVCGDREETLARFSPRTESTLEYDVTRCITRVAWPERPVIGLMTSLKNVLGGQPNQMMMMQRQQPEPGWAAFMELKKDYDVREIPADADKIDDDVKALVVLHAKDLSEKTLFAIDQFVIKGGRLIACVDPFSIMDMLSSRQQQNPMMQMGGADGPSTLGKLFDAWGIQFDTSRLVADLASATKLNVGNGRAEENPAFLSLSGKNMDKKDLLVSGLTQVMFPFAGALSFTGKDGLSFEPLIVTSEKDACLVDRMGAQFGMGAMRKDLNPDGVQRTLAGRLTGTFKTAFPKGPDWKEGSTNAVPTVVGGQGHRDPVRRLGLPRRPVLRAGDEHALRPDRPADQRQPRPLRQRHRAVRRTRGADRRAFARPLEPSVREGGRARGQGDGQVAEEADRARGRPGADPAAPLRPPEAEERQRAHDPLQGAAGGDRPVPQDARRHPAPAEERAQGADRRHRQPRPHAEGDQHHADSPSRDPLRRVPRPDAQETLIPKEQST